MQIMKCEMCGSNEFSKQDGMYVCEHCRTKYTIEEAKKLLVEGTVKVDETDKIDNYRVLARRAKESEDIESAAKYYKLLVDNAPNDWEAVFYSLYFSTLNVTNRELYDAIIRFGNSIKGVAAIVFGLPAEQQQPAIKEIGSNLIHLCAVLQTSAKSFYEVIASSWSEKTMMIGKCAVNIGNILIKWGDALYEQGGDWKKEAIGWYKGGVRIIDENFVARDLNDTTDIVNRIREFEPEYRSPREKIQVAEKQKKGGCYVATCVYGSYDCPEVWTLRRYRDDTLGSTWYGRAFIHLYYAVSPTIVKIFGNTNWFKKMWRNKLDKKVARLQASGVANTPYKDKTWC